MTDRSKAQASSMLFVCLLLAAIGCAPGGSSAPSKEETAHIDQQEGSQRMRKVVKSDAEWRKLLTREQYLVTRKKATERPFTGAYYHHKEKGIYRCVACGSELFASETKYDSGSGWPSFWAPVDESHLETSPDHSLGMVRTEILCSTCGAHLGHVFDDGPPPTGLRYCVNSAALKFEKSD